MDTTVHVMIDIETLCNDSSGGVILEIGACVFDFYGGPKRTIEKLGGTYGTFRKIIDIESSLEAGLKIEASTLRWWLEDMERRAVFCELIKQTLNDYQSTLIEFRSWLGGVCTFKWDRLQVWSHGASYDLVILENHYKLGPFGGAPWKFRNQNDTRTMIRLYKEIIGAELAPERNPYKHNSLSDACVQARHMQDIVSLLKGACNGRK